jgi:hypothetical protein
MLRSVAMKKITIDSEMAAKLCQLGEVVVLCDPSGNSLGKFIPGFDPSEWEPCEPEISEEELQRRENSSEKRYTTAEVLAYLEKL